MTATIDDIVESSVVFVGLRLLSTTPEQRSFIDQCGSEVTKDVAIDINIDGAPSAQGNVQIFKLNRERIIIESSQQRTVIKMEYPSSDDEAHTSADLHRLAQIADLAVRSTSIRSRPPPAFGYNIIVLYDLDDGQTAIESIGSRLFKSSLGRDRSLDLIPGARFRGGMCTLLFDEGPTRWTVTIEPRFRRPSSKKVYLNVNYHSARQEIPDEDGFFGSLMHTWHRACGIIDTIAVSD